MVSLLFSFIEFIFGILFIFLGISLYSKYPTDKKRKIFATILGLISVYYFIFASIQLNSDYKIVNILNQLSLISLFLASSFGLLFLNEFLQGTYAKFFIKFVRVSIFISVFFSLILLIQTKKPIDIFYNGNFWQYRFSFSDYSIILFLYFSLLITGLIVYLIILILLKNKFILKIFSIYSIIFLLPPVFFINFKNPYFFFLIINLSIFLWVIAIYFLLKNNQKELVNYYEFQQEIIEGIIGFQFLLNKDFYIIDTTSSSARKFGYKKNEILGMKIDKLIDEFDYNKTISSLIDNEHFSEISRIKTKDHLKIIVQLSYYKICNKKNELKSIIIIGDDIERRYNFEFNLKNKTIARIKFTNYLENVIQTIENLDESIAFLDEKGRFITANKNFLQFFKYLKDHILSLDDFIESKKSEIEKIIEVQKEGKSRFFNYKLRYIPKVEEFPLGYVSFIEDITEKEKTKNNLKNNFNFFDNIIRKFPLGALIFNDTQEVLYYSNYLKDKIFKKLNIKEDKYNLIFKDFQIKNSIEEMKKTGFFELTNYEINMTKIYNLSNIENPICNLTFFIIDKINNIFCLIIENTKKQISYEKRIEEINNYFSQKTFEKISFISLLSYELRRYVVKIIESSYILKQGNKLNSKIDNTDTKIYNNIDKILDNSVNTDPNTSSNTKTNINTITDIDTNIDTKIDTNIDTKIDTQMFYIDKIIENANNLLKIFDSIILYELIENNKLKVNYKNIEIVPFLNILIKRYEKSAKEKGLILNFTIINKFEKNHIELVTGNQKSKDNLNILLDIELFEIIFDNIMSNAIKFTEKGGINIIVNIKDLCFENCELGIKIKDSGIGIEQNNLTRIFNKYYQTDEVTTKKFQGLGLGLFFVENLLRFFGGQINIDSKENFGTEVKIFLPLMKGIYIEDNKNLNEFLFSDTIFIVVSKENLLNEIFEIFCKENNFTCKLLNKDILKDNIPNMKLQKSKIHIFVFNLDELKEDDFFQLNNLKEKLLLTSYKFLFIGITNIPYDAPKSINNYNINGNIVDIILRRPIFSDFIKKRIVSYILNDYEYLQ